MNRNGYMLDTTLFNAVAKEGLSVAPFVHIRLLATSVQASELRATNAKYPKIGAKLVAAFEEVGATVLPAASAAFDVEGAGFDQAHWNDGTGTFEKMLTRLVELDGKERGLNQTRDILIAETAIKNGATLVTGDARLRQVVSEFGGQAIDHPQFVLEAESSTPIVMAEPLDRLLSYCRQNGRVCPQPKRWNDLFQMLPETRRKGLGWEPAPLILAAWWESSDDQKQERLEDHIRWAQAHAALDRVDSFLRSLPEGEWHHVGD
jgi:hypothetical protein